MAHPGGRPSIPYDPEIGEEICERLATSEDGLEQVIDSMRLTSDLNVPSIRVVYKWLLNNEEFVQKYSRARVLQAQWIHDKAQEDARRPLIGIIRVEKRSGKGDDAKVEVEERTVDNVERSKLIVSTSLKRASQLDPKKYGDRIQQEVTGKDGGPIQVRSISDFYADKK